MPAHNSILFIKEAIDSVLSQSYVQWELLITEDGSDDGTRALIESYKDERIRYFWQPNQGAAVARNNSLKAARGQYIAFLDSDDIWKSNKLERQIAFMRDNNYCFSCTSYIRTLKNKNEIEKIVECLPMADFKTVLYSCPVGNLTVVYDAAKLGKIYAENIEKRNDYALWLKILKHTKYIYGLNEVLACYRVRKGSLSENKLNLIKYHWKLYRNIEKFSVIYSAYILMRIVCGKLVRYINK